ncbi:MAG: terminase small subunit [Ferruginibacter sp.]
MEEKADEIKLKKRQERFCIEYLIDLNATQAAIRAGYSEASAKEIGYEHLTKPHIRTRIENLIDERSSRTLVHADFVINNLVEVSQRCMQKTPVMVFNAADKCMEQKVDDEGNNVWEFDSNGANKALELLGKHLKMFTDKVEQKGELSHLLTGKAVINVISTGVPLANRETDIDA